MAQQVTPKIAQSRDENRCQKRGFGRSCRLSNGQCRRRERRDCFTLAKSAWDRCRILESEKVLLLERFVLGPPVRRARLEMTAR